MWPDDHDNVRFLAHFNPTRCSMKNPNYLKTIVDNIQPLPKDPSLFYKELTSRNHHYIDIPTQNKLRNLKVLVAGCGAGGGACLEPLARVGVTHFKIADVGHYELANLNRQHTFIDCLGMNKATFHEKELKRINPYIDVVAHTDGVHEKNIPDLVQWADLIFDCVDVTTASAIQSKIHLHEVAHEKKKPVFSMLDLGYCQWGTSYDYRNFETIPLNGRLAETKREQNPIRALLKMFPLNIFPAHTLQLLEDLLENPEIPCSQLGLAADLLSAVAVAAVIRFSKDGTVIKGWNINLESQALPLRERFNHFIKAPWKRLKIARILARAES